MSHYFENDKNLKSEVRELSYKYDSSFFIFYSDNGVFSKKGIDYGSRLLLETYLKNDKVYFQKQEDYKNGDDIIIAVKNNLLSVRRLYRYPKGIILQAMNPKYPTINVNIISNEMILGKVTSIYREVK